MQWPSNGMGGSDGRNHTDLQVMLLRWFEKTAYLFLAIALAVMSFFIKQAFTDLKTVHDAQLVMLGQMQDFSRRIAEHDQNWKDRNREWNEFWKQYGAKLQEGNGKH